MPFFFIVPIWLLFVVVGVLSLFFARARFLSTYLIVSATLGLLFAFLMSLAFLIVVTKLLAGTSLAWISLLVYLLGIVVGGAIGVVIGLILARGLNLRLGLAQRGLSGE
jgi:hypothetical protein